LSFKMSFILTSKNIMFMLSLDAQCQVLLHKEQDMDTYLLEIRRTSEFKDHFFTRKKKKKNLLLIPVNSQQKNFCNTQKHCYPGLLISAYLYRHSWYGILVLESSNFQQIGLKHHLSFLTEVH